MAESLSYFLAWSPGKTAPDTILAGLKSRWDSSGHLLSRERYSNGVKDGISEDWFQGGGLRVRYGYHCGVLDSATYWRENGVLSSRIQPRPGGDSMFVYDETGKLEAARQVEKIP